MYSTDTVSRVSMSVFETHQKNRVALVLMEWHLAVTMVRMEAVSDHSLRRCHRVVEQKSFFHSACTSHDRGDLFGRRCRPPRP